MSATHTIEDIYDITTALLTDNDTTFINAIPINLIKTIPGISYVLTIHIPTNDATYSTKNGKSHITNATENSLRGKITLYGNGRLIGEYTTNGAVAPRYAETDNFIKRFIRKIHERDFFRIVDLANCRAQGKIALRNNTKIFQELLKSQKTK